MNLFGGRRPRGDAQLRRNNRASTKNRGTGNSSGSCDTPDVGGSVQGHIEVKVDQEPYPNAPVETGPNVMGRQNSDGTIPINTSSGSNKRKSTDGAEPSSKGKKIQRAFDWRTEFFKIAAENSASNYTFLKEMVAIFKGLLTVAEKRLEKMDVENKQTQYCVDRLGNLPIRGPLRVYIMEKFTDPSVRIIWLHGKDEDVSYWIAKTFPNQFTQSFANQQHTQPFPNQHRTQAIDPKDVYPMNL